MTRLGSLSFRKRGCMDYELRLLITDPFHPVTAATIANLRRTCGGCTIVGVDPHATGQLPPPGVAILTGR
jgi:hypothetical protein